MKPAVKQRIDVLSVLNNTVLTLSVLTVFLWLSDNALLAREAKANLLWFTGFLACASLYLSAHSVRNLLKSNLLPVLFLGVATLSTIFALYPRHSLFGGSFVRLGLISYFSIICIAVLLAQQSKRFTAKMYFWLLTTFVALIVASDMHRLLHGFRLEGPLYQANTAALFLGMYIVVCVHILKIYKTTPQRIGIIVAAGLAFAALLLTQTRSTLICTVIAVAIYCLYSIKLRKQNLWLAIFCAGMLLGVLALAKPIAQKRLADPRYFGESVMYRLDLAKQGAYLLPHVPPLTGWGFDSIVYKFYEHHELPERLRKTYENDHYIVDSTHNVFLDRIIELGWVGGLLFMYIFFRAWFISYRRRAIVVTCLFFLLFMQYLVHVTIIEQELVVWALIIHELAYARNNKKAFTKIARAAKN